MKQKMNYLLLLGIIMIATNLRAPITSVGPLVGTITNSLNLTGAQAGLITTLPLIAFAIISPIAPKLARKFGTETTILGSLILIILGLGIRYLPSIPTLFLGTAILGCGIAVGNVLIPSIVKQEFQNQSGLVTGIYSVSMNLTGAIASGVSIPLIEKLGWTWNQAFSLWIILAALALLAWLPQLKNKKATPDVNVVDTNNSIWHSSLAWSVSLFMGIQSFIFYVLVAWLPEMLISQGIPSSKSGGMLSLLQLTLLPTTFIIPIIAEKRPNQKSLVVISFELFTLGISGLMFSSLAVISLSIIAIGIAGGIAFSLSMMFFNLRTSTPKEAADLSGMAQSIGYILAAVGPFLFGLLHDLTNNWQSSLFLLIGMTIILLFVGLNAGSSKKV
ncbi:CynX/NimT family MFS transporter [Vagococcus fluvialis]|uniref:CynX/NimT family MFS transporter n=1 Tax=Vagococcus fluvialis TaxID=2738 RepID=UPI0014331106|nr:MFS transporter [Vagococcus fluvialis]MBO0488429.1 MFS transporter [Vagococcus fluvialis]NKC60216.1 MFS transporter [Vagococcus fluvialis]NKD51006.1 MFS transporter [Vagococcus fluvialis]